MNEQREIYVPPEGPPPGGMLSPEIYAAMGEENIFKMLSDFYGELERSEIRHLFPKNMEEASKKSAAFFVFLLGGPPLYQQQFGAPMMRRRHLPFKIDEHARQVWLRCFRKILADAPQKYLFPADKIDSFLVFLERFSIWMVNTRE